MTTYVEVIPASQGLLPSPCPECIWWQSTQAAQGEAADPERRIDWMSHLEHSWGSVGLIALDGPTTVASVQFAPVRSLPRPHLLPPGSPPDEAALIYCLRGRVGRPARETRQLLHRALSHLRKRQVWDVYAYARPLGGKHVCGMRNMFGREFLEANGFEVVGKHGDVVLMRVDLRGLLPMFSEAGLAVRRAAHPGHPSPAAYSK